MAWSRICVAELEQRRAEIDALNVFPVPDSDTGTNLLATMRAALAEAEHVSAGDAAGAPDRRPAHPVTAALARGASAGARGNSGIILSQVLRGIAEATVAAGLTGTTYRVALVRAATLVRGSLSDPVEGTILTVLDRAGSAASVCAEPGLAAVVRAGADAAARALADTRDQLAVLREAGVVDAGARGLLVLLDGLVTVVTGAAPVRAEYRAAASRKLSVRREAAQRYEVMYRIDGAREDLVAGLRSRLAGLGDSVVVAADGAGGWSAHVHCADAGAAVEAGLAVGDVNGIRIEHLAEDYASGDGVPAGPRTGSVVITGGCEAADTRQVRDRAVRQISGRIREPADRGVLAVASGGGATALFEAGGAVVLSAERALESAVLLAAIRQLPHREVLVLPNGALPAHELVAVGAAARDAHRDVLLLPSASMVQGLAALAVHDRARVAVDDAFTMSEAAASTRWGALRRAAERALTMVGTCAPGDGLGLVGHDVVVIDRDPRAAGRTLLDRMLGVGGELVTLLVGAGAPDGLAGDLTGHIGAGFPGVEVTVYSGGQQGDLIQIGVE
ncbi:DAK2 domain-containing protein [Nocardia sp. NBC_01329]|uniref:DAK2 domain-containing protein n=1 Tax=Nocardia sp. NBC_01329 TaxID=2903594 RepID=UPI002E10EA6A|nr:DAK2 domain-containing protein [Nocardia sp. NBC_01329]